VWYLCNTHQQPTDKTITKQTQLWATMEHIIYKANQNLILQALIYHTTMEAIMLKLTKYIWHWVLHDHSHLNTTSQSSTTASSTTHTQYPIVTHTQGTPTPATDPQQESLKATIATPSSPSVGLCCLETGTCDNTCHALIVVSKIYW